MRTAIWTEHFADRGIEETIDLVADLGYDGVEITPWLHDGPGPTMSEETITQITAAVDRNDVEVAGMARVFGPDHDHRLASHDAAERRRAREYLTDIVDLCGALGGSLIPFGSGSQRGYPDDMSYGTAWECALDVLGHDSFLDRLETHDVTFGVEPLSPSSTNFLNTTPEAIRFVEEVDHPNVKLTLDGYHLVSEPGTEPELIRAGRDHLGEFHADDPNGLGPGSGDQDYERICETLHDVGFEGYVTVEFHAFLGGDLPDVDPQDAAERSLAHLAGCRSPGR